MTSRYGDGCAEFYDELYGPPNPNVIRTLSRLASNGSILELGLATGRTALALTSHCAEVFGIESSHAMLDRLASKANAEKLRVVEGDFATIRLNHRFDVIFALVNTLDLLETQELQQRCLHNVYHMLKDTGAFVVESYTQLEEINRGEREVTTYNHTIETRLGSRRYDVRLLYTDVRKLDMLAARAGLVLRERWMNWQGTPYTEGAEWHISVYRRGPKVPPN
jgi:SAM-dependent methyltransferase